ncbi:hypothetical protein RB653_007426 [Dictyostelium firmibasis]|uniref:Uncharacterized protein n=1 Tax=Dictyostelium firmibasis TaxID=79012 RepID=A0AAN7U170_9MYCE
MKISIILLGLILLFWCSLTFGFSSSIDFKVDNNPYTTFKSVAEVDCSSNDSIITITFPQITFSNFIQTASGQFENSDIGPSENTFSSWVVGVCDGIITNTRVGFFDDAKRLYIQTISPLSCSQFVVYSFSMIYAEPFTPLYCSISSEKILIPQYGFKSKVCV